ncbi:hypothetical protein D3C81_991070 [compost metagenome]
MIDGLRYFSDSCSPRLKRRRRAKSVITIVTCGVINVVGYVRCCRLHNADRQLSGREPNGGVQSRHATCCALLCKRDRYSCSSVSLRLCADLGLASGTHECSVGATHQPAGSTSYCIRNHICSTGDVGTGMRARCSLACRSYNHFFGRRIGSDKNTYATLDGHAIFRNGSNDSIDIRKCRLINLGSCRNTVQFRFVFSALEARCRRRRYRMCMDSRSFTVPIRFVSQGDVNVSIRYVIAEFYVLLIGVLLCLR